MTRLPLGCKGGLVGVAAPLSTYSQTTADQALYLGGSGKAGLVLNVVQDATVYTPAAQLSAETDVEEAHHGLPAEERMRISALMPVADEPTAPRISLWASLGDAVSRLLDWLTPAPVVESALVLATADGVVLADTLTSYMMAGAQGAADVSVAGWGTPTSNEPMRPVGNPDPGQEASTPPSVSQDPVQSVAKPQPSARELQYRYYWPSPTR